MTGGWKVPVLAGGAAAAAFYGALFVVPFVFAFGEPPERVDRQAAEAAVDALIQAGVARDFAALCSAAAVPETCEDTLADGAREAAPRSRPTLVESRPQGPYEERWVFTLKGRDGDGRPYDSELMVVRDGERLLVVNPVWWTSARLRLGYGE